MVVALRQPILKHDARDAMCVQPARDAVALALDDASAVTAAGTNHRRRARGLFRRGQMHGDGHRDLFGFAFAERRFVGPDHQFQRLRGGRGRGPNRERGEED